MIAYEVQKTANHRHDDHRRENVARAYKHDIESVRQFAPFVTHRA